MHSHTGTVMPCDISHIKNKAFVNGKLIPLPYDFYKSLTDNELKYFMLQYGIYVLPTTELIDFLKENTLSNNTIEIGCGLGCIGRSLNIPITDNRMQEQSDVMFLYAAAKQPVIIYPDDVIKMDAVEAVKHYKPDTVIGAFITHQFNGTSGNMYGPKEELILENTKRYINIGNLITHKEKPILEKPHREFYFPWIVTRSVDQRKNRIFIFDK